MFTAMLTVENIVTGSSHDVWEVNVEEEYHEETAASAPRPQGSHGTGRDAPVLSRAVIDEAHPRAAESDTSDVTSTS